VASAGARLARERRTIKAMIGIYCRAHHHGGGGLCDACASLDAYADKRLDLCPYGPDKPTCLNCAVHCYQPKMRENIRDVMRYAGPRMMKRHPVLAVRHLLDGRRPPPERPGRRSSRPPLSDQRAPADTSGR
jgi:hypothetical protein